MQNLQPNNVVSDKTSFFVIDPFGTSPLCIPLGGNICCKRMKIKKINFKSIIISSCELWN